MTITLRQTDETNEKGNAALQFAGDGQMQQQRRVGPERNVGWGAPCSRTKWRLGLGALPTGSETRYVAAQLKSNRLLKGFYDDKINFVSH